MSLVVVLLLAATFSATPSTGADETATTLEVDNASADKLWKCSNCPAINPAIGPLYTQQTEPIAVKLAYTILADGSVDDCSVLSKSHPELDDATLCGLVALEQYEATAANAQRRSVRRSNEFGLGPPGTSPEQLTGKSPE